MMETTLPKLPSMGPLLIKAGLRRLGRPEQEIALPELKVSVSGVTLETDKLDKYRQLTRLGNLNASVPPAYLQVLATPLHTWLLGQEEFPLPALGLVHLENRIESYRSVQPDETLTIEVTLGEGRWKEGLGQIFDIHTEIFSGEEKVWSGVLTALAPGKRKKKKGEKKKSAASTEEETQKPLFSVAERLPGDLGRNYASIGGDYNPIHLHPLLSKPFGFSRPIIHGMWTLGRCWSELVRYCPDESEHFVLTTRFKKPLFLPSTAAFEGYEEGISDEGEKGLSYKVYEPRTRKTYLEGTLKFPSR